MTAKTLTWASIDETNWSASADPFSYHIEFWRGKYWMTGPDHFESDGRPFRTLEKAQRAAQIDVESRLGQPVTEADQALGILRVLTNIKSTMLRHTGSGNRPRVEITFDDEADANRFVQALTDARIKIGGFPKGGAA